MLATHLRVKKLMNNCRHCEVVGVVGMLPGMLPAGVALVAFECDDTAGACNVA